MQNNSIKSVIMLSYNGSIIKTCSFSVNIASYFVFVPTMEKIPKEESLHVSKQHSSGVPERISVLNESNDSMTHL